MPSGKVSKQRRRAAAVPPPRAAVGGKRRPRQASPRALAISAGVVAALAVVLVIAVVLSGGHKSNGPPKGYQPVGSVSLGLPGAAEVAAGLKGIPQTGTMLGSPFAPVTLTEYIDLQCPVCRQFETQVFPDIVDRYVRTGKVKVVVKPWAFIGPDSFRGQAAMLAAARQDKAFDFALLLFDNQGTENTGWLTDKMIYEIAVGIPGMKIRQLFADRTTAAVGSAAKLVDADASANTVTGTPTLFVGKAGARGTQVPTADALDEATLAKYLDDAAAS
jgi:protein-disulfide isomerase